MPSEEVGDSADDACSWQAFTGPRGLDQVQPGRARLQFWAGWPCLAEPDSSAASQDCDMAQRTPLRKWP